MTMVAVKQVERKVTKIGNSLGVTLPGEVLTHLGISQGDDIRFSLEDGKVSIKKRHDINLDGLEDIDQEFLEGVKVLFDNFDDALRNLADG